jgi:hypothetical protein
MMTSHDGVTKATRDFERTARLIQCLPFDMAREQYGMAVQMGFLQ